MKKPKTYFWITNNNFTTSTQNRASNTLVLNTIDPSDPVLIKEKDHSMMILRIPTTFKILRNSIIPSLSKILPQPTNPFKSPSEKTKKIINPQSKLTLKYPNPTPSIFLTYRPSQSPIQLLKTIKPTKTITNKLPSKSSCPSSKMIRKTSKPSKKNQ